MRPSDDAGCHDVSPKCVRSINELATKFVLDVDANDVLEVLLSRGEAELPRPLRLEITRPAVDNTHDELIRHALDAGGDLLAGDALQGRDLLADRSGQAGHGEVA